MTTPIQRGAAGVGDTKVASQGATLQTPASTNISTGYTPAGTGSIIGSRRIPTSSVSYLKPDITTTTAITNSIYQNLMGRNASPAEIAKYHADFLKYAASHPADISSTAYETGDTGVTLARASQSTATGLSEQNYIENIVSGSADAKEFKAATDYFDAMRSAMNEFGGGF